MRHALARPCRGRTAAVSRAGEPDRSIDALLISKFWPGIRSALNISQLVDTQESLTLTLFTAVPKICVGSDICTKSLFDLTIKALNQCVVIAKTIVFSPTLHNSIDALENIYQRLVFWKYLTYAM